MCGTAKADLVRSIGADHVIDYTREDFADGQRRYDLILDIGGNSSLSRLRRALTRRGTLVIAGGEGARWTGVGRQLRALALSVLVRQRLTMYVSRHRQADLDTLRVLTERRRGHPGRRPDLPAGRDAQGHAPSVRRARPGKDRHQRLAMPSPYGDEVSRKDGGHDPQNGPDFDGYQQRLHFCPLARLGSAPMRLPDPLPILASGPGRCRQPGEPGFPPAAALAAAGGYTLQKEAGERSASAGYQTRWATSATSSSLRCWVSSLMRFPPMDTGENPHWVDSASRSLPT